MNNSFKEFFPFKEDSIKVYEDSIIVLDTNVLLDLYRYNDQNRAKMFEILKTINDRLYMPHWVAYEFMKNKKNIILQKVEFADNLTNVINNKCSEIKNSFVNNSSITPYLKNEPELKAQLELLVSRMDNEIKELLKKNESEFSYSYLTDNDPVLDRLTTIYEGRVGKAYSQEDITALSATGKERFDANIPPGHEDKKKSIPERYGDFFIWMDMIEYCKAKKTNLMFVSNDLKKDWCELHHNKNLGPRYELKQEFYSMTDNQLMHFTSSELFISRIGHLHGIENIEGLNTETKIIIENSSDPESLKWELMDIEREIEESEIMHGYITGNSCTSPDEAISLCQSELTDLRTLKETVERIIEEIDSQFPEEYEIDLKRNAHIITLKIQRLFFDFLRLYESYSIDLESKYEQYIEREL